LLILVVHRDKTEILTGMDLLWITASADESWGWR